MPDALSRMYLATYRMSDSPTASGTWGVQDNITILENFNMVSSPSDFLCQQSLDAIKTPVIVSRRHRATARQQTRGGNTEADSNTDIINPQINAFSATDLKEMNDADSSLPLFEACSHYFDTNMDRR